METSTILNIAAGKFKPLDIGNVSRTFLVNLDTMYYNKSTPEHVEATYENWKSHLIEDNNVLMCGEDAFRFMERTSIKFDRITCYRFLEHVKKTDVLYFIYLMSTCLKIGGEIDIIVPDYKALAKMILDEQPGVKEWEAHDIVLTYELLNDPSDPHASIWTADRLKYFFTLEGRFTPFKCQESYLFDGRDIYIRFQALRG
jgi:predicted SAM-dependent methyltransferase